MNSVVEIPRLGPGRGISRCENNDSHWLRLADITNVQRRLVLLQATELIHRHRLANVRLVGDAARSYPSGGPILRSADYDGDETPNDRLVDNAAWEPRLALIVFPLFQVPLGDNDHRVVMTGVVV